MSGITVQLRKEIGTIDPCIYGSMFSTGRYGMVPEGSRMPNVMGFRTDLIEAMKRARLRMLQWPAGDDWEYKRWRDLIGPRGKRPRRRNPKKVVEGDPLLSAEDNSLGIHEFLEVCARTGAEPYMGTTICYGNAADFHDLVEYCNCPYPTDLSDLRAANGHPDPFRVRYWCINNQGGYITPEEYCGVVRQYFGFIPFFDTPPLRVIRPDGKDGVRRFLRSWKERGAYEWMDYVPAEWNNLNPNVDLAGFIHYGLTGPCVDFTEEQWYRAMAYGMGFQRWIDGKREEFAESFNPRIGIGLNEWGCMHNDTYLTSSYQLTQKDTLRDALTAAIALNVLNNNCDFVRFACLSDMINAIHHLFEIEGDRLVCTPTASVYELYAPHHDGRCVATTVDVPRAGETRSKTTTTVIGAEDTNAIPHLQVSASLKGGTLTLTVVNTSFADEREARISVEGGEPVEAVASVLHHRDRDAMNTVEHPHEVRLGESPVRLKAGVIDHLFPAHSVTRFSVRLS